MNVDLEREMQTMRDRLTEAEELQRAIVRAEVDGFVVGEGDGDRYVHLLSGAYARDAAERQRRHAASDEHTRRFLSLLALELLHMLKNLRESLEQLKPAALDSSRPAIDSMDRQITTMARLAEDLRAINPRE